MFRHVLGGASVLALELASFVPRGVAYAKGTEKQLPPVTVDAPAPVKRAVRARPVQRPVVRSAASRSSNPPRARAVATATQGRAIVASANLTAGAAAAGLYQAPSGQTTTTVGRSEF